MTTPSSFQLRTFGGLAALRSDGRPAEGAGGQKRRLALLALVDAAGERGISRDKLLAYLWPESDPERARGARWPCRPCSRPGARHNTRTVASASWFRRAPRIPKRMSVSCRDDCHHAQAIYMSRMAEAHGANPRVLRLAIKIDQSQVAEIRIMQEWLSSNGQVAPDTSSWRTMTMTGMLSEAQLKELDTAKGVDFDRAFLTFRDALNTLKKEVGRTDGTR